MYIYIYIVRDGWLRLVASHLLRVGGLCVAHSPCIFTCVSAAIRLKQYAFNNWIAKAICTQFTFFGQMVAQCPTMQPRFAVFLARNDDGQSSISFRGHNEEDLQWVCTGLLLPCQNSGIGRRRSKNSALVLQLLKTALLVAAAQSWMAVPWSQLVRAAEGTCGKLHAWWPHVQHS